MSVLKPWLVRILVDAERDGWTARAARRTSTITWDVRRCFVAYDTAAAFAKSAHVHAVRRAARPIARALLLALTEDA